MNCRRRGTTMSSNNDSIKRTNLHMYSYLNDNLTKKKKNKIGNLVGGGGGEK